MLTRLERRNVIVDTNVDPGPLGGRFHDEESGGDVVYRVRRLPVALGASFLAGNVSAAFGIGGGILKVPVLTAWCGVPMRVSAATSYPDDWRDRGGLGADSVRERLRQSSTRGGRSVGCPGWLTRRSVVRRAGPREMAEAADGDDSHSRQHHLFAENAVIVDDSPSLVRLELRLGQLLVTGVVVSAALLATGLGLWLLGSDATQALWLLNAGLIVLMATPILRVVVSFSEYVLMRQWFFAGVTMFVLLELTVTVVVALSKVKR